MADSDDSLLPSEDEDVATLLADAEAAYAAAVDGWEPDATSDATPEKALMAANADEAAVLYALARARETDWLADFGQEVYGVLQDTPTPAVATTAWTARQPAPAGGYTLPAGSTLVIDAPAGRFPFQTLADATVTEGATTVQDVVVQAIDGGGSAANGATGQVLLDAPPPWVLQATITEPPAAGTDGEDDTAHLLKIRRVARLQSLSPVHVDDLELAAQDVPGVFRALARDNYDPDTDDDDAIGAAYVVPIDEDGQAVSAGVRELVHDRCAGDTRRLLNGVITVGTPDYTDITVAATVSCRDGYDHDLCRQATEAAITTALSPGQWGLVAAGEFPRWRMRRTVRPYEIAAAADRVEAVDQVITLELSGPAGTVDADGNVVMAGAAPLPQPSTVTATVVTAD